MKPLFVLWLIALIISACVLACQISFSQAVTPISGIITSNTTWTQASSPYYLTGNTLVNNGATLKIEPGVVVNLNSYYIMVNGTLAAVGNATNPISFIGGQITFTEFSTNWNESEIQGSIIESVILSSALIINNSPKIFNNTINNPITIQSRTGKPLIINNTIKGGLTSGLQSVAGPPSIEGDALISNNTILVQGISLWANATVAGNIISGISGVGIKVYTYSTPNTWYPYSMSLIERKRRARSR